ncbi:MAG: hypothetical protein J6P37_01810 [Lachnospiraceae bacterium]|nr:hypothetical protein [Lachnospiraceae bacterium]
MAIGIGKGHSRGGRPGMGGGSTFRGASSGFRSGLSSAPRPSTGFRGTSGFGGLGGVGGFGGMAPSGGMGGGFSAPSFNRPAAPMGGIASSPINININKPKVKYGGGGMVSSLVGSAVSAGVGVASAAIVNKIHENSQLKLQEKQAEAQAALQQQLAEQQAEYQRQQAEYQLELEKLKTQQEEIRRDVKQEKKYYANCPYCLGVNNGGKFCQFCGSSLAYYDDDDEKSDNKSKESNDKQ